MTALDDFRQYLADLEAQDSALYQKWAHDNPIENQRWLTYQAALLAGQTPAKPMMKTRFGKTLIDVAQVYLDGRAVDPPTPVPPPPTPPATGYHFKNGYIDPAAWNSAYATQYDAMHAAIPAATSIMAPLDASVVKHIPVSEQVLLVPNGCTEATFTTYGVPAVQTGKVSTLVAWDEPDESAATIKALQGQIAMILKHTPGVKIAVTGYDAGTLAALIAALGKTLVYLVDNYPARTSMAEFKTVCQTVLTAGAPLGIVLDAFEAPNYSLPTPQMLQDQIDYAHSIESLYGLSFYAWGTTGGTPINAPNNPAGAAIIEVLKGM